MNQYCITYKTSKGIDFQFIQAINKREASDKLNEAFEKMAMDVEILEIWMV